MSKAKDEIAGAIGAAEKAKPSGKKSRDGGRNFQRKLLNYELPEESPVQPIGLRDDKFYYIDANKQMRILPAGKHSKNELMALYGDQAGLLYEFWPRVDDKGNVSGWAPELAGQALMEAAAREGVIDDITDRVRGPGCWLDDDGNLVMHCGAKIFVGGKAHNPGKIEHHVYPAAQAKPTPLEDPAGPEYARDILSLLSTWNWRRPDVDPYLLLGWLGAAMVGGALDWRPAAWLTGDRATGKSTLQHVVGYIMGRGSLLQAADTTAAGIWQSVGMSSLPVAIDEMESEEDNRRNAGVINLARLAASGGVILRGGSDHGKVSFKARSCFLFSSILIPPLRSQDVSRLAILQLDKISGAKAPALNPEELAKSGRAFRRRLMEQWPRFRQTLEAYRMMLADQAGHSGRSADQFGTLLACCDLLMYDAVPDADSLDEWAMRMQRSGMAEVEDDIADYERCLWHLLSMPLDIYRGGEKKSVGRWIMEAAGMKGSDPDEANKTLMNYGMKVKTEYLRLSTGTQQHKVLQVANSHQGMASLFKDTHWGARSGTSGVWRQSLARVPGAVSNGKAVRFDGVVAKCVSIPLDAVIGKEGDDE